MDNSITDALKSLEYEEKMQKTSVNVPISEEKSSKISTRQRLILITVAILLVTIFTLFKYLTYASQKQNINTSQLIINDLFARLEIAVSSEKNINKIRKNFNERLIFLCREAALEIKTDNAASFGGFVLIDESKKIIVDSKGIFTGKQIDETPFGNVLKNTTGTFSHFFLDDAKMYGRTEKYKNTTILGYVNIDYLKKASDKSAAKTTLYVSLILAATFALLLFAVTALTINPIKNLIIKIAKIEQGKYLDADEFGRQKEFSALVYEINKMLTRINYSEKTLSKIRKIKKMLQDLLLAESISLRISNAFVEIPDFDAYIQKLIRILENFMSGDISKLYRIRIAFIDKEKNEMFVKYLYNSSTTISEKNDDEKIKNFINDKEIFPPQIEHGRFAPVVYYANPQEESDYRFLADFGVKSAIFSPIYVNGKYRALLEIETFDNQVEWREIERKIIHSTCWGISSAFARSEIENERNLALFNAKAESESKSEFLATISHEILTPINAIIGLSEIQLQKDNISPHLQKDLEKILENGTSLFEIVNKIFDFSKIQHNEAEIIPTKYYLRNMLASVCKKNFKECENKKLKFIVEIDENLPEKMFGDENKIRQILNHLISNAIKFTEKGRIKLSIKEDVRTENNVNVIFSVSDTGPGINFETQKNMLSGFSQADSSYSRNYCGIGIGFSIAREFVKLMGGQINISSEADRGSDFTFAIIQGIVDNASIGKFDVSEVIAQKNDEYEIGKKHEIFYMPYGKVLIVDDVKTNLDVAKGMMLPYGIDIDCVSSGKKAIKKIEARDKVYDLVLMDHMMPEMDGIETVKYIREKIDTDYAKNLPIVALTANFSISRTVFFENGFNDCIFKPIDKLELDKILIKYIHSKQSAETLEEVEKQKHYLEKEEQSDTAANEFILPYLKNANIKGLNISYAMDNFGGSAKTYMDVLSSFVNSVRPLTQKLCAVKKEMLQEYAILIHGIKGSCYGIGAAECGDLAKELETLAKKGDFEQIHRKNKYFVKEIENLSDDINKLLEDTENAKKQFDSRELLEEPNEELLRALIAATGNYETDKMNEIISKLDMYKYKKRNDLITFIKEKAVNFAYDEIEKKLISLFVGVNN